jgi:diguanylate cyclase (GGDEF)-like protein/putative nucleotidyltransferase with HDIG domain
VPLFHLRSKSDPRIPLTASARAFIFLTAIVGACIVAFALINWKTGDLFRFISYLLLAAVSSGLRVQLPDIDGTMSVNFLFIIVGILELSFPETIVIACTSTMVQCLWNVRRSPQLSKVVFNVFSMMAPAVTLAYYAYFRMNGHGMPLMLMAAVCTYFVANTVPVAVVIALTEKRSFAKVWKDCYFWSLPYYLVGAAIAALVSVINRHVGWQFSLLVLPVVYWIYRSYNLYLGRLEDEKKHVEEVAELHLRTIEALALAIEAKDHTTHDHLQRVRVYALELGKDLKLNQSQMAALQAAALLHDIGKLAVPEHIINKPGRLTPEEFDKMKIHPVVGAEILERVNFPYPVAEIVRAHHEKWNGTGYPDGLKGEDIPIGARILTAVDYLDALASDRQYRRALPLDEAMEYVAGLAGTELDPTVIELLKRRYVELEKLATNQSESAEAPTLSTGVKVERGAEPAAGFEVAAIQTTGSSEQSFLSSIAAARQEAQAFFELSHDLGNSLRLDETLSVLAIRLGRLVPYNSVAVYVRRGDRLVPQHVGGDNFRLLASLEIPLGQGLSGWVAQHSKPILNGNPTVEPGYINDPSKFSALRSAVSIPLEGLSGVVAVLTLYHAEQNAFTKDHLRILLAISSKMGLCIENALKYQQAETSATVDFLTGLPNARSLFLHLDRELSRCKRTGNSLAVIVCDLDGFKQVNDRFGHLEGNKLLKLFATQLRAVCREYDCVARMGGDEFVIVAPDLEAKAAETAAERFAWLARDTGRKVCREDLLSLSVGAAFFPGDGTDAEHLLAEADRNMYLVKQKHHDEALITTDSLHDTFSVQVN